MSEIPHAPEGPEEPPPRIVAAAIEMSTLSPCRSKRGVVIFRERLRIASGYNFKPRGFDCDGADSCKATCNSEAVHAEQMALLKGGLHVQGCDMLHVKTVEGALVPSGGPSCVQCSKLALASGIAGVWLYHEDGWRRYEITEFHRLSLEAGATLRAEVEQFRQPIWSDSRSREDDVALARQLREQSIAAHGLLSGLVVDATNDERPLTLTERIATLTEEHQRLRALLAPHLAHFSAEAMAHWTHDNPDTALHAALRDALAILSSRPPGRS